jgi:hypothetical protein
MLEFASNTDVTIQVPYEYNGTSLVLTGFEYEVLDAEGATLIARQADPDFSASNALSTLVIPTSANTTSAKRDARLVNCYLITATGTFIVAMPYLLKGNQLQLTVLTDSFMTYAQSVLIRAQMAEPQDYFDLLTDELKAVALEEAFHRIAKLKFKVDTTTILDIKTLQLGTFTALNPDFLLDLRKAQIAEANNIVENSPIRDKIRSGIISETIGESSMFFRQAGVPVNKSGLNDQTEVYLKRWVYLDASSSQTWRIARA